MIRFLIKGILRDKNRSLLPIMVVTAGVVLTVLMQAWLTGVLGDMLDYSARYSTGHVKIMTRAYAENVDQLPNDLALIGVSDLTNNLSQDFPDVTWVDRISFGGLLDAPDENGETKEQGTVIGLAVDMLGDESSEVERLNIKDAIREGSLPDNPGEILISRTFAEKLDVGPGDEVTLISSTMYGSMAFYNFTVAGLIEFGVTAMDRGAIVADINDVRLALDMNDAAGEILGYFNSQVYNDDKALALAENFNSTYSDKTDEFSPIMKTLGEQNEMDTMIKMMDSVVEIVSIFFIIAMSLVLWNAGLLGGLRRYGEFGLRLAIGEPKGHVYRSMIGESVIIGIIGTIFGTIIGLILAYLLQIHGIDIAGMTKGSSMMMPTVMRAKITAGSYYVGFFPGLLSTVIGTMLSGIGIYKRKTAQLFKELEV